MMRVAIETLNAFGPAWAGAMQRSLVEASALLALAGLAWSLLRRWMSSAFAHGMFLLVLVKAVVPIALPLTLTVPLPLPMPPAWSPPQDTAATSRRADRPAPAPTQELEVRTREASVRSVGPPASFQASVPPASPGLSLTACLMLAWGLIVAGMLGCLLARHVRMARRLRGASPLGPDELPAEPGHLATLAGLRHAVPIVETEWVAAHAVWGLVRPSVLVPPGLIGMLSRDQLKWVLLHELTHVRRGDPWILLFQRLAQMTLFFHPAVWAANRAVDAFREFACDDASLALAGVPRHDCGAGFLAIAERACGPRTRPEVVSLGLFGSHALIRRRLEGLLDDRRPLAPGLSRGAAALLGVVTLVAFSDVRAQTSPPQRANPVVVADPPGQDAPKAEARHRELELRVVDGRSGKPLQGAAVRVQTDGTSRDEAVDEAGRTTVNLPRGEWGFISLHVRKDGFVPAVVGWNHDGTVPNLLPATYTLRMEPGTSIGGEVRDTEGKPVAGATVFVLVPRHGNRRGPSPELWDYPCKTDTRGRWQCPVIPAELEDVWLRLEHPDYISDTHYGSTTRPPLTKLRDGTGVMVVKKGLPVSGVVRDDAGKPIVGAKVTRGSSRPGGHYPEAATDVQGRFRFAHVAPGDLVLTVQANGHAPDLKSVKVVPDLPPVEFRLPPGRSLRGRVVDEEGRPVAGAWVTADEWRGHRSLEIRSVADADGRFLVDDLPEEAVQFQFSKSGYMNLPNQPLAASAEEYVITLKRPLRITGPVTDAATGRPIEDFTLFSGGDPGREPTRWERDRPYRFRDGRYEVDFRWPYPQIRGLRVEAEGYLPATSRGFHSNDGGQVYDFKLTRGTVPMRPAISGVVLLPDGEPAAGAEVGLATTTFAPYVQNGRIRSPERHPTVSTGPDGQFTFPPQTDQAIVLAIHDRGIAERTEAQLAASPTMSLRPWGRVEGTLRLGSKSGVQESVALLPKETADERGPRIHFDYKGDTDTQGRFVFERVVPGAAAVSRSVPLSANQIGFGPRVPVEVKSGETARVSLGGTGRPVVGRVIKPTGAKDPIDGSTSLNSFNLAPPKITEPKDMTKEQRAAWYKTWKTTEEGRAYLTYQQDLRSYPIRIEADGSFRLDDVAAGTYNLVVNVAGPPASDRPKHFPLTRRVVVPEIPGGRSDEPLDLGTIELAEPPRD